MQMEIQTQTRLQNKNICRNNRENDLKLYSEDVLKTDKIKHLRCAIMHTFYVFLDIKKSAGNIIIKGMVLLDYY